MAILFALILGFVVFENTSDKSQDVKVVKKIDQVSTAIEAKNKAIVAKTDPNSKDLESPEKSVKPDLVKEEVKPDPVKEEVKPDPVKEEVKPDPVKEEVKPDPVQEKITNAVSVKETNWFKIGLYILGLILSIITGSYFYKKLRNNSSSSNSTDFMRKEFKEEAEVGTSQQQPVEEETQTDTSQQQPVEEETQTDTSQQQPVEEDDNNKK